MEKIETLPIFFIIGRPRTGTTLLRTLFDAHPNVIIPPECALVLNLFPKYGKVEKWDEKKILSFYEDAKAQRKFASWLMDDDKVKENLLSMAGENTFQNMVRALYHNYNSFFHKNNVLILGDKNPVYSINIKQIYQAFPDAKFIHLTRDYRDNIVSILKVDFEAPLVPLIVYRWKYSAIQIEKLKSKHHRQFYTIKYEDFVNDYHTNYRKLCEFVGIDYDENVFDFYKKKEEIFKIYPEKQFERYHKSLLKPITNEKVGIWKNELSEKDVRTADAVAGKYAELLGYERKYKRTSFRTYVRILPALFYGRLSYVFGRFINILPLNLKMAVKNRGSILALLYWKVYSLFKH